MKVVVVNGPAGAGKDRFIGFANDVAPDYHLIVETRSMVDKVKEIATVCGWKGQKTDKDRKFLSDLKDLTSRYNDLSYADVAFNIDSFAAYMEDYGLNTDKVVYFVVAREPNDIARFVKDYNATTVFIDRGWPVPCHGNHADDEIFDYSYDYTIKNVGTLGELKLSAESFLCDLFGLKRKKENED